MGRPVERCSSPSSSMMSVPEAGLLPSTFRPIASSNGWITASGKPFGYVGKGRSRTTPAISQCPVVLSLPAERSVSRPWAVPGPASGGTPRISVSNPSPSAARFGASIPPAARAQFPRVFVPSSPYSTASGAAPTPKESHTTSATRGASAAATRSRSFLFTGDAETRPGNGFEPFRGDGLVASLAQPVGTSLHLVESVFHVEEVRPQLLHKRDESSSLGRAVRTVGEPAFQVDREVFRVGI